MGRQLAAQEPHDLGCREVVSPVAEQLRIELSQGLGRAEQHVGGPLALFERPVVFQGLVAEELPVGRMELVQQIEKGLPPAGFQLLVAEFLGSLVVFQLQEAVVALPIAQAGGVELAGQPLAAVDRNVDREREPGLQAEVHEPELAVLQIEVVVQALLSPSAELQHSPLGIAVNFVGEAGFHGTEDTNQAFLDAVAFCNLASQAFLGDASRVEVAQWPIRGFGQSLSGGANLIGDPLYVGLEILEEDAAVIQKCGAFTRSSIARH